MKALRFSRRFPCPICGGHPDLPHGKGLRCVGFLSTCGKFARCTREQHAGRLSPDPRTTPETYVHWLAGPCKCGVTHDARAVPMPASESAVAWTPMLPVPDWAPPADFPAWHGRPLTKAWTYHDRQGRVLYHRARHDKPGGKDVIPRSFCEGPGGACAWRWVDVLTTRRPLYGLDLLSARPDAEVLLVEGEKAADGARLRFPALVVVAWPNGTPAVPYIDWTPLRGRVVTIWPDNDDEGLKAARVTAGLVLQAGARSVRLVAIPAGLPEGWDLGDLDALGVPG